MRGSAASFIPPIALDFDSETPLYRQISVWFQRAILAGQLRPGQRVPSTRTLARALKVSRIPVLSAFELLVAEGYFEPIVGAGTCVSTSIPDAVLQPRPDEIRAEPVGASGLDGERKISRRAMRMRGPAQEWLVKCPGCTAVSEFPGAIWSKLVNRNVRRISKDVMGYGDPRGYWPFREALAEYLGAFRAVKCEPSQILVTTGSQQALQIAALALLDPNDGAWIEEPGYPGAQQALKAAGARLIPVPVDEEGLSVTCGIRRDGSARLIYVTPSHQFPLGVTMSAARRIALMNWAACSGSWIVEDDYDSEFRYGGNPIASLQGLDSDSRVIYVGSLSKVMFPALRLGFMVIPRDLVESFWIMRHANDTFSPLLPQMAMCDFIREGHFSRHIRRMRVLYMERRKLLVELLTEKLPGVVEASGDEAGMQLLMLLPPGVNDLEVANRIAPRGFGVKPLSQCYMNPPERGGLVLGYGNLDCDEIRSFVAALETTLNPRQACDPVWSRMRELR